MNEKTYPSTQLALNWYDLEKDTWAGDFKTVQQDLAFNMKTSTIKVWRNLMQDLFYIEINHNGVVKTLSITEDFLHNAYSTEVVDVCIDYFMKAFAGDHQVPRQLLMSYFKTVASTSAPVPFHHNIGVAAAETPNFSAMSRRLPGMRELVKHPVEGGFARLYTVIISLNDKHLWPREKIADWLETLDVDLTFRME